MSSVARTSPSRLRPAALVAALAGVLLACGSAPTEPLPPGSCPPTVTVGNADTNRTPPARPPATTAPAAVAAGGAAGSQASQDAGNYAGTWSGQYHLTGCTRGCGLGPNVCDRYLAAGGVSFPLRVRLTQDGLAVSGTLDLFDNTGFAVVETGPITGTIDSSGALVLSGTTYATDRSEPAQTTLSGWHSELAGGDSMRGNFTQNRVFRNAWGTQQLKMDCELVDVRRAAP